jgi:8-oxo-dGTP diphosphatase
MYSYEYPHPAVTTDVVLFTIQDEKLMVLLIQRANDPNKGRWCLPGGFVDIDEGLEQCARRELEEETGVSHVYLEQLYTFGKPDRDPRERIITVAYYAMAPVERLRVRAASDASAAAWFPVDELPDPGFDHRQIINLALRRLASKLQYSTLAMQFMPQTFTLGELQKVYEIILGEAQDKRNFRKRILAYDCLEETGEIRRDRGHRPARLYRLKFPGKVQIIK